MENKQSPSKKKLLAIREEKLIREVNYDSLAAGSTRLSKKQLPLELEILQTKPQCPYSQRVLVSIKPRAPVIKTLFIAEKSRFHSKKSSDTSGSRLAIGDHSSFTAPFSEDETNITNSIACGTEQIYANNELETKRLPCIIAHVESSSIGSRCSPSDSQYQKTNVYNTNQRPAVKCYIYTQLPLNINLPKLEVKTDNKFRFPNKVNVATLIVTNTSSEASVPINVGAIKALSKRIDHLEHKILKHELVFRSMDPNVPLSSSDEDSKEILMKTSSATGRPGCSYIQQYSHIPETSAFQRYAQQAVPLTSSKATTLDKEHNSEQYGRDFTAYDGITARGRRQCASVPCKRDDIPKMAAERVHKIRHKLNPVRDYRLMDTVHYLAQGEFAPRDDGIKLTPSREAVLSDIIWEDVCRTHWPTARLGRRNANPERCSTRYELQRLIDNMLRERVAHVERRRRRHYRIVKLNHRHESCRPLGKTGDIIVASHKNKQGEEIAISDHNTASAMISDNRWEEPRKTPRSHDRLGMDGRSKRHSKDRSRGYEDCSPGPSHAKRSSPTREPTYCYQTTNPLKCGPSNLRSSMKTRCGSQDLTSVSSSMSKSKAPKLVVKKDTSYRKHRGKEEPDLEHYILLPTLVVRTPSNMRRQKKFNELYHRILNVQLNNGNGANSKRPSGSLRQNPTKKDVGLNINIIE